MKLNRGIILLPVILAASIIIVVISIFIYQTSNNKRQAEKTIDDYSMVKESEIDICKQNSDCIVVPYDHCCGSTKRAINKKYKTIYFTKPSWQKFIGPCHLMGICPNDSKVTEATCENYDDNQMKCKLKY